MIISYQKIKSLTVIYATVSIIAFFLGWLNTIVGVIASAVLLVGAFFLVKSKKEDFEVKSINVPKYTLLVVIFLALLWCFLSGNGEVFIQKSDNITRNAMFRDLINYDWPVMYSDSQMMVYYIAHWLIPASVGKLAFLISNSSAVAVSVGNITLFIWTTIGVILVMLLVLINVKAETIKKILVSLSIFIVFSGLDVFGSLIMGNLNTIHLEWWATIFQYSSNTTCLFWVYNQAIIPWAITLCVINEKKISHLAILGLLALPFGPFPFVGIFAICVFKGILELIKYIKEKKVGSFFAELFSIENISAIISIIPVFGLYFTCNNAISTANATTSTTTTTNGGFRINEQLSENPIMFLIYYLLFVLLEFGIYFLLIKKENKKNPLFVFSFIALLVIPFFQMGAEYDFCMRASIPFLIYLTILVIKSFISLYKKSKNDKNAKVISLILTAVLCFGAITPLVEIESDFKKLSAKGFSSIGQSENTTLANDIGQNFVSNNYQDSAFYKYLAKK